MEFPSVTLGYGKWDVNFAHIRSHSVILILFKGGPCAAQALTGGDSRNWLNSRYFGRWTLQRESGWLIRMIQVNQKHSTAFCSLQVFSLPPVNWRVRKRRPFRSTKARERPVSSLMAQANQTIPCRQTLMNWNEAWGAVMRITSAWSTSYGL